MSRWLVGSSSTSRLQGDSSIRARASRAFSPPESLPASLNTLSLEKQKLPSRERTWVWVQSGTTSKMVSITVLERSRASAWFCSK